MDFHSPYHEMWEAGVPSKVSTAISSAGGMMQEGALTLGGCMWSLIDLYAIGFTGVPC